jgi:hypothetical protein
MALYEDTEPLARPLFMLDSGSAVAAIVRRSAEWVNEASGLARGLAELASPLKWHFAVVFGFNVVIAIWETVQPFILAWGVDTLAARVPYLQIVAIIVFPALAIGLPQGIVLPFARDLYAAWFVKPQYEKRVVSSASRAPTRPCIRQCPSSTARRRRSRRKDASPLTN